MWCYLKIDIFVKKRDPMTKSIFEVACVIFLSSSSFICLFNPLTPKISWVILLSVCPTIYVVSLENLELDQPIIPLSIFFFILVTCLLDILLIMQGEILSRSLARHKGLIGQKKFVQLYNLYQRCKAKKNYSGAHNLCRKKSISSLSRM